MSLISLSVHVLVSQAAQTFSCYSCCCCVLRQLIRVAGRNVLLMLQVGCRHADVCQHAPAAKAYLGASCHHRPAALLLSYAVYGTAIYLRTTSWLRYISGRQVCWVHGASPLLQQHRHVGPLQLQLFTGLFTQLSTGASRCPSEVAGPPVTKAQVKADAGAALYFASTSRSTD